MRNTFFLKWTKIIFIAGWVLISGCNYFNRPEESPTNGMLKVYASPNDSLWLQQMKEIFELKYKDAKIIPVMMSEELSAERFLDSGGVVVLHRNFTQEEQAYFGRNQKKIHTQYIGSTALALVVGKDFPIDSIDLSTLKKILNGTLTKWSEIGGVHVPISLYLDFKYTGGMLYLRDSLQLTPNFKKHILSIQHPDQAIAMVNKVKGGMALIPANWLTDEKDSVTQFRRKEVKILKLGREGKPAVGPFQSQIADGSYPLVIKIYMHEGQGHSGLGKGLMAFAASQSGQLIIKQSGMMPAIKQGRTIQVETKTME